MTDLILIGGGGHCRSVIDVIESTGMFRIVAIVDKEEHAGRPVLGYKITHSDKDLPSLVSSGSRFLITIGQIKSPEPRAKIFSEILGLGGRFATVISSKAYVSRYSTVGVGSVIMHGAVVNAGASVGDNCIINSQALIEHDAIVESHCHIATGAILNGGVLVRERSFVGSRSVVRENSQIEKESVVPAGTAILTRIYER